MTVDGEIERVFRAGVRPRGGGAGPRSRRHRRSPRKRCRTRSPSAVQRWPATGLPPSPAGWIITTARNRAIDRVRREASREERHAQAAAACTARDEPARRSAVHDDRLRLIFTCCHPALAPGGAGRADAAPARRPDDGRDRARVPGARGDDGAAAGAGEGKDPRRGDPVSRAGASATCPNVSAPCSRSSTDLQRRLHGELRRPSRRAKTVRRSDPARRGCSPS